MTDKAIQQDRDAILFASKASLLLQKQKIDEALNLCETGVRHFPFYSPGHYTLALCYEALGQQEDAKNEFERTLVYDPSHSKAMRKLSDFYRQSGLDQMADELLIKEALYSPLNPEIINLLKEKDLYKHINPIVDEAAAAEKTLDNTEEDYEAEVTEVDLQDPETTDEPVVEVEESPMEESPVTDETIAEDELPDDESGPIDNLDPLAVDDADSEEFIIDNPHDTFEDDDDDLPPADDFSPLMEGYLARDEENEDDEQWMEVENLLDGDEEISEADVDPVPEGPKDETEMLLEQLSSNDDDDINLEAAVMDPVEHIDLTSDSDKANIASDEIPKEDLAAGIVDPMEKKPDETDEDEAQQNIDTEEEVGETISEIISNFTEEQETAEPFADESDEENRPVFADEESDVLQSSQDEHVQKDSSVADTDSQVAPALETTEDDVYEDDLDEEVTINDMLANPNLVTPTFGEILIAQHKFSEARHVFVELSKKEPDNTRFMKKIQFLDKFLQAGK